MKTKFILKQVLVLLFLFIGSNAISQPVLLSSEKPQIGDKFFYRRAADLSMIDTSDGINQTWNFSQLTPDTFPESCTQTIDPMGSPHIAQFPNSNYVTLSTPDSIYTYSRIGNIYAEMLGYAEVDMWGANITTYLNTRIYENYPVEFGSGYIDVYSTANNSGTTSHEVIGTGTLILPFRTFNDVLLKRHIEYLQYDTLIHYSWLDSDSGVALLSYLPIQPMAFESAVYLTGSTISVEENTFSPEISFINPVNDNLNVTIKCLYPTNIHFNLIDFTGKLIAEGEVNSNYLQKIEIDLLKQSDGIYSLYLTDDFGRMKNLKVMKY